MKAAIALTNPKYPHNVGQTIRACSCWGLEELYWSGKRVPHPEEWFSSEEFKEYRIPREERMKGYANVKLTRTDRFKDIIDSNNYKPIAVEVMESSENLFDFIHPENALYIFGPEDGGLSSNILQHCHRFVMIPTAHCLNLASAVNIVLAHRARQFYESHAISVDFKEARGFIG